MVDSAAFYQVLVRHGVNFFVGVPDSLLVHFNSYLLDIGRSHLIVANEGAAVAFASGWYLATSKLALVYFQNSGLGNAVNPLVSLVDPEVYGTPMLLLAGWRGEPGIPDEPQHMKQGRITPALLDTLEIPHGVLPSAETDVDGFIAHAVQTATHRSGPFAILARKGVFGRGTQERVAQAQYELSREEAVSRIVRAAPLGTAFVATTGMLGRELFEWREARGMNHDCDFLNIGAMGHASQIALGIALCNREVYCLDGDGAAIMHMGAFAVIGQAQPTRLTHVVINNGAHDSVGGQPTAGFAVDFVQVARACGYRTALRADNATQLDSCLRELVTARRPLLLEVRVRTGTRGDLGRPTTPPVTRKQAFMRFLADDTDGT